MRDFQNFNDDLLAIFAIPTSQIVIVIIEVILLVGMAGLIFYLFFLRNYLIKRREAKKGNVSTTESKPKERVVKVPKEKPVKQPKVDPIVETIEETKEEPIVETVEEIKEEPIVEVESTIEPKAETLQPILESTESNEDSLIFKGFDEATGDAILVRYDKSFTAKLIQTADETKNYYNTIKNALLSYDKVTTRTSWKWETFHKGHNAFAKMTVRGKTLYLYLPLDTASLDSKYKVTNISSKSYSDTPCLYKIKNDLRSRYAMDLINLAAVKLELVKGEDQTVDYYLPYEETEALISKELIKEVISTEKYEDYINRTTQGTTEESISESNSEASIEETPEVAPTEESSEASTEDNEDAPVFKGIDEVTGAAILVRYSKSYHAKLIQSYDETKNYYNMIKNALLRYEKTTSKMSWKRESIHKGHTVFARLGIRRKTLYLYLPLNPDTLDPRYKVTKVNSKFYSDTPCLYRITNDLRSRYAIDLINFAASNLNFVKGEEQNVDYYMSFEEDEDLVKKGLIKELISNEKYEDWVNIQNRFANIKTPKKIISIKEAAQIIQDAEEEDAILQQIDDGSGLAIVLRYYKSFEAKLILASDETKRYYGILKNALLSYKKVKARTSWRKETINRGNTKFAKFTLRGKTLYLYLALDHKELDPKYKVKDVMIKAYAETPCLYKIKNEKRVRYALELIELSAKKLGLVKGDNQNVDYYQHSESLEALAKKGLVKELVSKQNYEVWQRYQARIEEARRVVYETDLAKAYEAALEEAARENK